MCLDLLDSIMTPCFKANSYFFVVTDAGSHFLQSGERGEGYRLNAGKNGLVKQRTDVLFFIVNFLKAIDFLFNLW